MSNVTEVRVALDWTDFPIEVHQLFKDGPFSVDLDGTTKIEGSASHLREMAVSILAAIPLPESDDPLERARSLILEWCDGEDGPLEQAVQLITSVIEKSAVPS